MKVNVILRLRILSIFAGTALLTQAFHSRTMMKLEVTHQFMRPDAKVNQSVARINIRDNTKPVSCKMTQNIFYPKFNFSSDFFKVVNVNQSVRLAKPIYDQMNKKLWFAVRCHAEGDIPLNDYGYIFVEPNESGHLPIPPDDVIQKSGDVTTTPASDTGRISNITIVTNGVSTENSDIASDRNVTHNATSDITTVTVTVTVAVIVTVAVVIGTVFIVIKRRYFSRFKRNPEGSLFPPNSESSFSNNTHPVVSNCSVVTSPHDQIWPNSPPRIDNNHYNLNYSKSISDLIVCSPSSVWEFPRHRLRVLGRLGEGCFGQVWKCHVLSPDGEANSVVAVKTLKETSDAKERQDLLKELELMKGLDPHPNVVQLLGCCTEKDPIYLILEYMSEGTLLAHLRQSRASGQYGNLHNRSSSLTSRDLTSYGHQIARGMLYLTDKGVVHRDLAARNVLLSSELVCKVADFGLARDVVGIEVYEKKTNGRLPIRWMAPESLHENIFTMKTDAWSFGILLWEIITLGLTPYPGFSAQQVVKKIKEGYRLERPEHCNREMYNLMYYCWYDDPGLRPDFKEIVNTLESFLLSDLDYIELDKFPERLYYNGPIISGESPSNSNESHRISSFSLASIALNHPTNNLPTTS